MGDISRVELHKFAHIPALPDQVWNLITDWAGMLRWWLTAEHGGLQGPTLVRCELVGNHGDIPRTRRMFLDNGTVTEEQIFYQNDVTRRIYYSKAPDQDITGYLASTYVDATEGHTAIVHISSQFDVRNIVNPARLRARYESVYESMFRGYQHYFTRVDT